MIVDTTSRPAAAGPQAADAGEARRADRAHAALPSRRVLAAWFGAFAVYAGAMIFTRHADGTWAAWGCAGYVVTALLLLAPTGWAVPLAAAVGGALIAPLLWLITTFPATGEVVVIGQSASYLLKHGTPYLPPALVTGWTSYNPYLPLMEVFGLPRSAGLPGILGDPRIWTTLTTVVLVAAAFAAVAPHRLGFGLSDMLARFHRAGRRETRGVVPPGDGVPGTVAEPPGAHRGVRGVVPPRDYCRDCRVRAAWCTGVAVASPLIAFPLAVGVTDPPIIALTCLVLAWAGRGKLVRAGVALGVACAMKTTAWAVVPVLAAMTWARYAPRAAARLTATAVGLAGLLALLAAPAALATPDAVKLNLIDYPMGATRYKTVAASPLPGHLIAGLGPVGRLTVDVLMVLAVLAFIGWLIARPPRDERDAAVRLAVGYAVIFTLDPSTRFGYFAYPLALVGWLALSKRVQGEGDDAERRRPALVRKLLPRRGAAVT
jgi:Glycosyltransferase family 87